MIRFVETGRVDDIGSLNRVDEIGDGDAVGCQQGEIGRHAELRHLAALHGHGTDAEYAIQRRLQVVGGQFPQAAFGERCRM